MALYQTARNVEKCWLAASNSFYYLSDAPAETTPAEDNTPAKDTVDQQVMLLLH